MKVWKKALLVVVMASLALSMPIGSAWAKTYKITVVAGHPPIFLWVTLAAIISFRKLTKGLLPPGASTKIGQI